MCTAISDSGFCHLFGRTLDLERSYGESAVITPRDYRLEFIHEGALQSHPAMVGIACVRDGVPLYYDAVNQSGLCAAALNFPGNAVYHEPKDGKRNVASFELIPYILSKCRDLAEAVQLLRCANITKDSFSPDLPTTPLHWLIADKGGAITVESVADGLRVYDNPFGVLTNNPDFPYHMTNISNYMQLSPAPPENRLCPSVPIGAYSRGMGALGLPGDLSSASRFVRAVFAKSHTVCENTKEAEISRFFHIMDTVSQPRGCAVTDSQRPVATVYTSCADTATATYYFTTYACRRIRALSLERAYADPSELTVFPLESAEDILRLNTSPPDGI
ncbi:MAG: choloylglycine hydrolase [Clostridia bacterium]|nr:choloylglycine hydrolase [Clostridia bacterium]